MSTISEPASKFAGFWAAQERKRDRRERADEESWFRLHTIRSRRPMDENEAREVWEAFVQSHVASPEAALGELVAALIDAGMLSSESKWAS